MLKNIYINFISPTGGVKKIAHVLFEILEHNTSITTHIKDITSHKMRRYELSYNADDLVIWCTPTIYERMPIVLNNLKLNGNQALSFICAIFGNRSAGDCAQEFANILNSHNFKVIGYSHLVCQNSQHELLGKDRPNTQDFAFYKDMLNKIITYTQQAHIQTYTFTQKDYIPRLKTFCVPSIIEPSLCDKCGMCVNICPQGIIEKFSFIVKEENKDKCMGCKACIAHCPTRARGFDTLGAQKIAAFMQEVYKINYLPKDNSLYLP